MCEWGTTDRTDSGCGVTGWNLISQGSTEDGRWLLEITDPSRPPRTTDEGQRSEAQPPRGPRDQRWIRLRDPEALKDAGTKLAIRSAPVLPVTACPCILGHRASDRAFVFGEVKPNVHTVQWILSSGERHQSRTLAIADDPVRRAFSMPVTDLSQAELVAIGANGGLIWRARYGGQSPLPTDAVRRMIDSVDVADFPHLPAIARGELPGKRSWTLAAEQRGNEVQSWIELGPLGTGGGGSAPALGDDQAIALHGVLTTDDLEMAHGQIARRVHRVEATCDDGTRAPAERINAPGLPSDMFVGWTRGEGATITSLVALDASGTVLGTAELPPPTPFNRP
jgi:hypothetical protein